MEVQFYEIHRIAKEKKINELEEMLEMLENDVFEFTSVDYTDEESYNLLMMLTEMIQDHLEIVKADRDYTEEDIQETITWLKSLKSTAHQPLLANLLVGGSDTTSNTILRHIKVAVSALKAWVYIKQGKGKKGLTYVSMGNINMRTCGECGEEITYDQGKYCLYCGNQIRGKGV